MIEPFHERIDRSFEIGEVDHPSELRIERTADRHLTAKRVSVHAATLVSLRHVRQEVRRFEAEVFDDFDDVVHVMEYRSCESRLATGNFDRLLATLLLDGSAVMTTYSSEAERTLGTIIKDLTADLSMLFRSEIALLKLEMKDAATKLGGGAALLAGALTCALIGIAFLFVTITLGLVALGVPAWLSALIVTLVLFGGAAVLGLMGKKKLETVNFVPSESIEHIRSDIDALKAEVERVRSR